MVEFNSLDYVKRQYPHFLDRDDDSNFIKHLMVINNQYQDLRHKLRTVDWGRIIEKPLQIWKVQDEPYVYDMNFKVSLPRLKEVNVYRNPKLKGEEMILYDEVMVHETFDEEDNVSFYEKTLNDLAILPYETLSTSTLVFDEEYLKSNHIDNYILIDSLPTPSIELKDNIYILKQEDDSYSSYELTPKNPNDIEDGEEVAMERIPRQEMLDLSLTGGIKEYDKPLEEEFTISYVSQEGFVGGIISNQFYLTSDGEGWELSGGLDGIFNIDNEEEHSWMVQVQRIGDYYIFSLTCDENKIFETQLGETPVSFQLQEIYVDVGVLSNIKYGYDEFAYYVFTETHENIPYILETSVEEHKHIIPKDNYLLEVYTYDDYRFIKGFPENDYTFTEDNILQYKYNETFLSINQEEVSYSKYLVFRVHKDRIKRIRILKNDVPYMTQEFDMERISEGKPTGYSHYYYHNGENGTILTKQYEIEDSLHNNFPEYFMEENINEYVYYLPLNDEDFEDEHLKDNYDLIVDVYDKRYSCRHDYEKTYSKRYNGYDDELNDCFDHDYSLDLIGNMLNVPRYRFYQVYKETPEYYELTYPPYNDRMTEDDYHYMKRIIEYIGNYNRIPFPILEFWKNYQVYPELRSRKRIVGVMDETILRRDGEDLICDSDFLQSLTEGDYDDEIIFYSVNHATNSEGESISITRGADTWYENVVVNDCYIVPGADYRFRYGYIHQTSPPVTIRGMFYNNQGNLLRSIPIIPEEHYESDELYDSDSSYEYVDTIIQMPQDATYMKLLLESNDAFQFKDVTFERMTVGDYNNKYMTTTEDYNGNFYELYANYDDIPSNIRIGDGERFQILLKRSLPLTKKGLLYMNINNPIHDSINMNTSWNIKPYNILEPEKRSGTISNGHPYMTITDNNLIKSEMDYVLELIFEMDIQSETINYGEPLTSPIIEERGLLVEMEYIDDHDERIGDIDLLEDRISSDVQTLIRYTFRTPESTDKVKITIHCNIETELTSIRLYANRII